MDRARELLAAEYEAATPGSEMAKLVLSGAKLEERGLHAAALRAIEKAYQEGVDTAVSWSNKICE